MNIQWFLFHRHQLLHTGEIVIRTVLAKAKHPYTTVWLAFFPPSIGIIAFVQTYGGNLVVIPE
ncbi:TPA: hypothetical protein EYO57_26185 [Candidatus Poribacteria bacterium]|nr:hypothetical protein [Candidatus Poribacteria bacterium]